MQKILRKLNVGWPVPQYRKMSQHTMLACNRLGAGETEWYPPVLIGAGSLAKTIVRSRHVELARDLLKRLAPDDYSEYMMKFYEEGLKRFGEEWGYADIVTVLIGLAEAVKPKHYLEIGVRRGRSACAVARIAPACHLALFDMWIPKYAGMENPGPEFVKQELNKIGHKGECEFINGNSHETLQKYFGAKPDAAFDIITVDGDHSAKGASQDLCDVLPHLAIGGAVVFDDVCHPAHPDLRTIWQRIVVEDLRFSSWKFDEAGYGVGFAIRKW